jgi:hypothetical protein
MKMSEPKLYRVYLIRTECQTVEVSAEDATVAKKLALSVADEGDWYGEAKVDSLEEIMP